MDDLIDTMAATLVQFSTGNVQQPLRTVIAIDSTRAGGGGGFYGVMPAFMPQPAALGTKLVTVYETNAARGLPTHLATIVLLDPDTGELLAILDGRYITEARTAAVSAVSARHLARADARVLAIVGSGVQARSHIEALIRVRRFEEIRVWGRDPVRVFALVEEMLPRVGTRLVPVESAREAVRDAGIVALVTAAREPVVAREWIAPGAHICAVGACRPDQREMDTPLVGDARVFVDSLNGALAEAGDLVIPIKDGAFTASHIVAELGEVVAGRVQGRQNAGEITIFKSLGMAVEDVAAARLAWERASQRGLGRGFVL
jgi:ornithine cyclodeaminase/alanine dehydrogenase-like protein (mu-crystallin family)